MAMIDEFQAYRSTLLVSPPPFSLSPQASAVPFSFKAMQVLLPHMIFVTDVKDTLLGTFPP